jgi:hypothetical protein
MGAPSPPYVLSGASKIAQVYGYHEAAGDKIRSNSQGCENVRVIGERRVLMVVYLARAWPAKFENIDQDGLHEAPKDFE